MHTLFSSKSQFTRENEMRFPLATASVSLVILLMVLMGGVMDYLNSPQVYVSNSTGKCVKVVSPKGEHPCAPGDEKKYERVWVK